MEGPGHELDVRGLNGNGLASTAGTNGQDRPAVDSHGKADSVEGGASLEVAEGIAQHPSSMRESLSASD